MSKLLDSLDDKKIRDIRVLGNFISIFCRENHGTEARAGFLIKDARLARSLSGEEIPLCADCHKLLAHGIAKLAQCPYEPKPMCKKCETHCYAPGYREKIREIMKFSGLYLVKHGRLDLLAHYLF